MLDHEVCQALAVDQHYLVLAVGSVVLRILRETGRGDGFLPKEEVFYLTAGIK